MLCASLHHSWGMNQHSPAGQPTSVEATTQILSLSFLSGLLPNHSLFGGDTSYKHLLSSLQTVASVHGV